MHKIKRNNFINMKMSSLKDTYKKKKKRWMIIHC